MLVIRSFTKFICLFAFCALLTACYARIEIPMHNPQTGEDLVCHSDKYYFEQGGAQEVIALGCVHACERYGFRRFTGHADIDAPMPLAPRAFPENGVTEERMKSEIPKRCLP